MRIALISDIHGHAVALEAVIADIQKQTVDQIICLGDTVTIGCQPLAVMARLRALNCPIIRGNHDAALLQPEKASLYKIDGNLIDSLYWCLDQLSEADLAFIRSFPPLLRVPLDEQNAMLCFHGSPASSVGLILATTPEAEIDAFFAGTTEILLAGGHSHIQMLRRYKQRWLINPGSVGNAFHSPYTPGVVPTLLPWAEYGIIEWQQGVAGVDLRRIHFDMNAHREAVLASSSPSKQWWLKQYQVV